MLPNFAEEIRRKKTPHSGVFCPSRGREDASITWLLEQQVQQVQRLEQVRQLEQRRRELQQELGQQQVLEQLLVRVRQVQRLLFYRMRPVQLRR